MNLFDIIKTFNTKKDLCSEDIVNKLYQPYVANRSLSNMKDTIFYANEMNRYSEPLTTKMMQHDFYFYSIPKKNRYGKWYKPQKDKAMISIIKELYNYSDKRAEEVVDILNSHKNELIKLLDKGGRK